MTIELKPELENLIKRDVERGSYQSIDEYLERAVQILHEEEEILAQEKESIDAAIGIGLAELDRGEGIPGDVAHARRQQRKEAFLSEQQRS